jgi:FkbM family methyltransferase
MHSMWKNLRRSLAKRPLARKIYFRTWILRYAVESVRRRPSYAQAKEDLLAEELVGDVKWFVDIGAHDGISGSNTFKFALDGAQGLCLEPLRETFTKLRWLYLLNDRVTTSRLGVSDQDREADIVAADVLAYIPETEDRQHSSFYSLPPCDLERISLRRFSVIAEMYELPHLIDLLSIDVEGHELNVLRSIPFDRYAFKCIIVETHLRASDSDQPDWSHRDLEQIESLLEAHGYTRAATTYVNTIYVHRTTLNS